MLDMNEIKEFEFNEYGLQKLKELPRGKMKSKINKADVGF